MPRFLRFHLYQKTQNGSNQNKLPGRRQLISFPSTLFNPNILEAIGVWPPIGYHVVTGKRECDF